MPVRKMNLKAKNDIFIIPNYISLFRVFMGPVILYMIAKGESGILLISVISFAILTDFLDGMAARKLNQISEAGKIIDPIADKIIVAFVLVGIVLYRDFPLWALVTILTRDLLILSTGMYLIRKRGVIPVSNMVGKITVNILALAVIAYLFHWEYPKEFLLYLTIVFVVISVINYYFVNFRAIMRSEGNK